MIAISLDHDPSIPVSHMDQEAWSGIDPKVAVADMAATADPDKLYDGMSLHALARASNPERISQGARDRLSRTEAGLGMLAFLDSLNEEQ